MFKKDHNIMENEIENNYIITEATRLEQIIQNLQEQQEKLLKSVQEIDLQISALQGMQLRLNLPIAIPQTESDDDCVCEEHNEDYLVSKSDVCRRKKEFKELSKTLGPISFEDLKLNVKTSIFKGVDISKVSISKYIFTALLGGKTGVGIVEPSMRWLDKEKGVLVGINFDPTTIEQEGDK